MTLLPYKAIILDFDGVLVESNGIKDKAFEDLFASYPEYLPAIMDYHWSHALIRFRKFRHIYEQILKRPYTPQDEAQLARAFSDLCIDAVIRCPEVKGARAFLDYFYGRIPLYIVSINPPDDLGRILEGRSLSGFFKKVYTVEGSKADALREILAQDNLKNTQAVFIGDSRGDYDSARESGVDFIGRLSQDGVDFSGVKVFKDMDQIRDYLNGQ